MTTIPTIRADLATLKDAVDVSGPLALFLGAVLDRIEVLERPHVVYGPTKHPAAEELNRRLTNRLDKEFEVKP